MLHERLVRQLEGIIDKARLERESIQAVVDHFKARFEECYALSPDRQRHSHTPHCMDAYNLRPFVTENETRVAEMDKFIETLEEALKHVVKND